MRRNGIGEVMRARTAAGVEPPGEDRGWVRCAKRNAQEWKKNETKDRAWILMQLEERVGDEFPRKFLLKHVSRE